MITFYPSLFNFAFVSNANGFHSATVLVKFDPLLTIQFKNFNPASNGFPSNPAAFPMTAFFPLAYVVPPGGGSGGGTVGYAIGG